MSPHIRIKICGITRVEDALTAATAGADAIGLVFYRDSPRYVEIARAQKIIAALPPFVTTVGLFINADKTEIAPILDQVPLDILQFHGDETAEFCRHFQRPYIKAVRVQNGNDIQAALLHYADARALLFDAYCENAYGGTGKHFDWSILPEKINRPWILAGGLNPDNIARALTFSHANAVDVSSGVESAKGVKDAAKITAFVRQVRGAA